MDLGTKKKFSLDQIFFFTKLVHFGPQLTPVLEFFENMHIWPSSGGPKIVILVKSEKSAFKWPKHRQKLKILKKS